MVQQPVRVRGARASVRSPAPWGLGVPGARERHAAVLFGGRDVELCRVRPVQRPGVDRLDLVPFPRDELEAAGDVGEDVGVVARQRRGIGNGNVTGACVPPPPGSASSGSRAMPGPSRPGPPTAPGWCATAPGRPRIDDREFDPVNGDGGLRPVGRSETRAVANQMRSTRSRGRRFPDAPTERRAAANAAPGELGNIARAREVPDANGPVTVTNRPSLDTAARNPAWKTRMPCMLCVQHRWWVPTMST